MLRFLSETRFKYLINILIILLLYRRYVNSELSNKKVYYFENEKRMTWMNALNFCRSMNMTLLTIRSRDEYDYLKSLVQLRYKHILHWWLDAYKLEGVWKWISSGDNITEFFWHEGEPNDNSGHEKCIHTWDHVFDWNDNDCVRKLPFICEAKEVD